MMLAAWRTHCLLAPSVALAIGAGGVFAQEAAPAAPEASAGTPEAQQGRDNWASRCVTPARQSPLECSIEQRLIMQNTQQVVAAVTIRVPAETGAPVLSLRAPLGVFLPGGVALDVDGAGSETFEFQACDNDGCYASGPLSETLLGGMTRGQKLNIKFQNLNKQTITVTATLVGFTAAFQRIR
jgi:invasion protein IalB